MEIFSVGPPQIFCPRVRRSLAPAVIWDRPIPSLLVTSRVSVCREPRAILPSSPVSISPGQRCPAGTITPTVVWCRWYAGQLGLFFLDKNSFHPEAVSAACVHRLVTNHNFVAFSEGSDRHEVTTSHSYSDGRCPDYRSCVSCLPRVLECYCIHDSVAIWNVTVAEVPKFELQVGECIAASMTLEVTPCLDLMGRECLHLRGAEEPWLSIPWFFAHVRATCNAQPLAHESSAPTRCFDTDWLYGGGSVAMQDASLPTISQYFSIHVSATGFAFSSNSFYNESLPHANAPSTSRDDCSRLIPLAKGVNMIIDRDARYTKVFDSPTTAVIILEPHARAARAGVPPPVPALPAAPIPAAPPAQPSLWTPPPAPPLSLPPPKEPGGSGSSEMDIWVIVVISLLGLSLLCCCIVLLAFLRRRKRRRRQEQVASDDGQSQEAGPRPYY